MRQSKPAYNISATEGWSITTKHTIVERRIKELTLGSRTLLLHAIRLWPEPESTIMCPFYFNTAYQRYNILEIDKDGNMPEQNFSGLRFQICSTDYLTRGQPVFFLEAPLQGGPVGLPKWEPRARTGVYLVQSTFHAGSVDVILNTIAGHVSPQYHVIFDGTLSTVEHMRK